MKLRCPECGSEQELNAKNGKIPKHAPPRLDQFTCDASGYIHPDWGQTSEQRPKVRGKRPKKKAHKKEPYLVVKCPECLQEVRKTPGRGIVGHVVKRTGKQCTGAGRGKRRTEPKTVSGGLPELGNRRR